MVGAKELGDAFKRTWDLHSTFKVSMVGDRTFIFEFGDPVECNRALFKQPWNFHGSLIAFRRLEEVEHPMDLNLTKVPFWLQLHGLHFNYKTRKTREKVGMKVGQVLEVDIEPGNVAYGLCLRVRVLLNISKPLCRGTSLTLRQVCSIIYVLI